MTTVRIRALTRTFAGHPPVRALSGVDLDITDGTLAAVLGPSGCGKTTLLRTMAGMERADGGTIAVGDRVLTDAGSHVAPERRRIGLVPQEGALFPHLDVAGNVAFGLRRLASDERRRRVDELLELVDLAGHGGRRPHELSGGQQQRVALARALAPRPAVVLLDEPFSALDTALRSSLRDEVADVLAATGTTAILVTHDQEEALSLADHVAIMRDGRIVQAGTPTDLYRRPVDRWTARFLGDANELPGRRTSPTSTEVGTPLGTVGLDPLSPQPPGTELTVLVRPEQIVRDDGPGSVGAVVERVRFRGSDADVTLTVGPTTVTARWRSTELADAGSAVMVRVTGPVIGYGVTGD